MIAIKGLDMPKEGVWYNIMITSNGKGFVDVVSKDNALTKTEPIQAVEIPTPHGRLIDADDFIDVCEMLADKNDDRRPFEQAEWIAKDMQTILEAETE